MLNRWIADWPRTGVGARVTMVILSLILIFLVADGALYNLRLHDYGNVLAEIPVLVFFLGCYVIWPYRIGWAVRRRGGSFGFWFTAALVFSGVFVGIFYWAKWSGKPVLAEEI
jgi:hypothetical protein